METEWTSESVIQLIEEYKNRPELWDKDHDYYRVQSAKYEAWYSLANMFGVEIVDLKKKFNSIFASRRREKAKIRGGGKSKWFLYNHLEFLSGHLDQPDDVKHLSNSTANDEEMMSDQDQAEDIQEQEITIKKEPVQVFTSKMIPPVTRRVARPIRRKVLRDHSSGRQPTSNIDGKLLELHKLLRKVEVSKNKDECDIFGEYIASSLRKHDERTQSMIKQAINNILFEQEMKKYNNAGSYTVIISDQDNPLGSVHMTDDILCEDNKK